MTGVNFCTVSSFGAFFLFPLFITSRREAESDISLIMGAFSLSAVICRPWVSDMIDRIGRKQSYTIGCAIMATLPLFYLFFRGGLSSFYLPLIIIRVLHGVGLAICFTAAFTYIADIVPEERLNEGLGIYQFRATSILKSPVGTHMNAFGTGEKRGHTHNRDHERFERNILYGGTPW
jgi:MFS family permease